MDTQSYKNGSDLLSTEALLNKRDLFEPEEEQPPRLLNEFAIAATPTQEMLLAAQAGYNDSRFAYTPAAHGDSGLNKPEEEKKKEEQMKLRSLVSALESFSFGGIQVSFENAMKHLNGLSTYRHQQVAENLEAAQLKEYQIARYPDGTQIMTAEDLEAFNDVRTDCPVATQYSADQITEINGMTVAVDVYYQVTEENEKLLQQGHEFEQVQQKLASGELTLDDLSDDMKQAIVDVERNGGVIPESEPQSVLEQLDALNGMEGTEVASYLDPQIHVAPTLSFAPSPPNF